MKEANAAARGLLREEARALRRPVGAVALAGLGGTAAAIGGAWCVAVAAAAVLGNGEGWMALAGAAGCVVLGLACNLAQERLALAAGETARARLRERALDRILALGPAGHPAVPEAVGARASLLVDRVEATDGYFARYLPARLVALAGPALVASAAALVHPPTAWLLLGAGLLVPVAMALTGIGAAAASRRQFEALQSLSGRFLDRMRGLPTLVLFNRQAAEAGALGVAADELRRRTLKVLRIAFLSTSALELLAAGALAAIAWRHRAVLQGGDPTVALFALLLVPAFFAPLRAFAAAYHDGMAADGAAAALAPLLDLPAPAGLRLEAMPPRVVVTFSNVRLTYDPARPPALDGLSFRVNAGETVVLTGATGAGKSSVLRLLMGFARAEAGRVAINGHDIAALRPDELRRMIAFVGQRPHLFRATLRENIRFARPEADDAAVDAAAAAARVAEFASLLPAGLDTLLGEEGFGLSGGERQRVALARAFLRDTPLVLLDEPTAHLDPGTEAAVLESLRRLCVGRTALVASHSTAAARALGRVIELSGGRVVDSARAARG